MSWPLISVIVPTYRREEPLRDTLADLVQQDYPNFEVWVIDQTPTHTPEVQAYLAELVAAGKIRWLRVEWASLPGARNYGLRRATGEIILFIDDDVRLGHAFLTAHARNYVERPEVGAVAGRVLGPSLAGTPEEPTIDYLPPEAMDPAVVWYHLDLVHTTKPQPVLTARGCNMSFRRDIFEQHGLSFDERFGGNAIREESDLFLRLRQTGLQIWYDPEAALVHLGEQSGGCHMLSLRSAKFQVYFYHNHFLLAFKNLTASQILRSFVSLFEAQVLSGRPPYYKTGSLPKISVRAFFYLLGLLKALTTAVQATWSDGQIYSHLDSKAAPRSSQAQL